MRKLAAAFVSIGVILVIVGLVLVGIYGRDKINNGGIFSFGSPSLESANTVFERQPDAMQDLSQITVSVADYDIYILSSENDVLSVKFVDSFEDGEEHLYIDYYDDVLNISQSGNISSHHWGFNWFTNRRLVAVYIPQNAQFAQVKISLYADYSSVNIGDIDCANLYVKTQAGSVKIDDLNATEVSVETSAGSVNVDNVECKDMSVSTDAGSVNVKDTSADNSVYLTTGAGSITCDVSATGLTIKSGAGSIKFETNASVIELHSGAGSIKGTVIGSESQYDIKVRNDLGSCNISNQTVANATKFLKVESDVGSVNIKFDND